MALKGFDRTPKAETRVRRNSGRLNNFDTVLGDGLTEEGGLIVLSLATDPGLEFSSGALRVKVAAPIIRNSSGVGLSFGTGLRSDSGTLKSKDSEIDHDSLLNFAANEHIDWTNASSNLVTTGTGTFSSLITSKVRLTPEGGIAIALTNRTGGASVKGTVVQSSESYDSAVASQADQHDAVGVIYNSGIADGSDVWVVVSGVAEVLLEDSTASTHGNWVYASTVDGRANATLTDPPGAGIPEHDEHFKEIGHCIESKTAGTDVLAKCLLHFN